MSPHDKRTAFLALVSVGLLTALWFAFFAGDRPIPAPAVPPLAQQPDAASAPSARKVELAPVANEHVAEQRETSSPSVASSDRTNAATPSKLERCVSFLRALDPERFGNMTLD